MTISDVAKRAGVSKTTVSRVLNYPELVKEDTLKKVKSAMEDLNFAPNVLAQSMRINKTYTVGVVIPDIKNPFYTKIMYEIELALRKYDYMMMMCPTSGDFEREKGCINRLLQRKTDGILFFTYNNSKEHIDFYTSISKNIPFILMDESLDGIEISQVVVNGYAGVKNAVNHLIAKGHKKIACLSSKYEAGKKRFYGYTDALLDNKIPLNKDYIVEAGYSTEEGYKSALQLLKLKERPTAIVAVADSMAIGAIKAMADKNIQVPEEIEVIGFDNIEWATIVTPTLSTVNQKLDEIAQSAVDMLVDKISHPSKVREVSKKFINCELILRQSTK